MSMRWSTDLWKASRKWTEPNEFDDDLDFLIFNLFSSKMKLTRELNIPRIFEYEKKTK